MIILSSIGIFVTSVYLFSDEDYHIEAENNHAEQKNETSSFHKYVHETRNSVDDNEYDIFANLCENVDEFVDDIEEDLISNEDTDDICGDSSVKSNESNDDPHSLQVIYILIAALVMRHGLTGDALADLLTLLNIVCFKESSNGVWLTISKFRQFLLSAKYEFKCHYYCSNCLTLIDDKSQKMCDTPSCSNTDLQKTGALLYFIEVPIIMQICAMFKRKTFCSNLDYRFNKTSSNNITDIYDGQIYRELFVPGKLKERENISLTYSTDGVPVFRSSQYSIWPLYFTVNELPYKMRIKKEFVILGGLWFGKIKPHMLTYLHPYYLTLRKLETDGCEVTDAYGRSFTSKAFLIAGTADLPARCMVCNMVQYNGKYSCHMCIQEGETFRTQKGGSIHVFPYKENDPVGPQRTKESVKQDVQEAVNTQQTVRGIKGPCVFSYLDSYDLCRSTAVDVMHGVYLGCMKLFLTLWFGNEHKSEKYSFYNDADKFSERLKSIKPPNNITRAPRSIYEKQHFKASELRSILLFYPPALYDILSNDYMYHFLRLSFSIFMLSQEIITEENIVLAETYLRQFCSSFEELYGRRFMTLNIHNLLHLPNCVRNLGPLWTSSCFSFEDVNGKLLRLIHGTQGVEEQIICSMAAMHKLPSLADDIIEKGSVEYRFYDTLHNRSKMYDTRKSKSDKKLYDDEDIFSVGSVEVRDLTDIEFIAFTRYKNRPVIANDLCAHIFKRISINHHIFHSKSYTRVSKRNSCAVRFTDHRSRSIMYGHVICYMTVKEACKQENCNGNCDHVTYDHLALIERLKPQYNKLGPAEHIKVFEPSCNFDVCMVPIKLIHEKCVFIEFKDVEASFVSLFPNLLESD